MKDLFTVLEHRATCRNFKTDPIPMEVLERLLAAAASAPSSGGFQNTCAIVVTDPEKKAALAHLSRDQAFVAKAPVDVIFCVDHRRTARIAAMDKAPKEPQIDFSQLLWGFTDAVISAQTFCLAAEAAGLRSCYNGNVIQQADELCRLFDIPKYVVPVIMLSVGYSKEENLRLSKKYPWQLMTHWERYSDADDETLQTAYAAKCGSERFPITEKKLEKLRDTAVRYHGEEWAQACAEQVRQQGELSSFQYWLGCFYSDKAGDMDAAAYLKFFEKQGFAVK